MAAPRAMTENTLNALKGWSEFVLDFVAPLDPDLPEDELPVLPGTVVSLTPTGKYTLGVGTDPVMPLFLFTASDNSTSYYVGGDPATSRNASVPLIGGTAGLMAFPAVAALELVSTAFVDGVYAPNDMLTAAKSGDPDPGKLAVGTLYTDMIVGVVSRGVVDNGYGQRAVAFWPHPIFPTP